jgi:hypothetical protein
MMLRGIVSLPARDPGSRPEIAPREGVTDMKWVKKILFALAVLFAGFYLITRPEDAADAVRGVFLWVAGAVTAVFTFFTSLAS